MGLCNIVRPVEPTVALDGKKVSKEEYIEQLESAIEMLNLLRKANTSQMSDEEIQRYSSLRDYLDDVVMYMQEDGFSVGWFEEYGDHELTVYVSSADGLIHLHEQQ